MALCPTCNYENPDDARRCECCDFEMAPPLIAESTSGDEVDIDENNQQPTEDLADDNEDMPSGSMILILCMWVAGAGTFISVILGFYLASTTHPYIGMTTAIIGFIYNMGLLKVFREVNQIIINRERNN